MKRRNIWEVNVKMKIETGLFPYMVLQRDGKVAQKAAVTGTCAEKGVRLRPYP